VIASWYDVQGNPRRVINAACAPLYWTALSPPFASQPQTVYVWNSVGVFFSTPTAPANIGNIAWPSYYNGGVTVATIAPALAYSVVFTSDPFTTGASSLYADVNTIWTWTFDGANWNQTSTGATVSSDCWCTCAAYELNNDNTGAPFVAILDGDFGATYASGTSQPYMAAGYNFSYNGTGVPENTILANYSTDFNPNNVQANAGYGISSLGFGLTSGLGTQWLNVSGGSYLGFQTGSPTISAYSGALPNATISIYMVVRPMVYTTVVYPGVAPYLPESGTAYNGVFPRV